MKTTNHKIKDFCLVTDFVANGSFASLKENVKYLDDEDYAILVRFTDYVKKWKSKFKYVSLKSYNFLKHSSLQPGDLIMSNVGDPGQVFILPDLGKPMTLVPNSILIRPEKHITNSKFLFYYFQSTKGINQIKKIITSTAQSKFNKTSFRDLEINLPSLADQKKIISKLDSVQKLASKYKEVFLKIEILSKSYFQNIFDSNKNEYVKVKDLFKINENKIKLSVDDTKMVSFVPMASVSEKSKSITEKKLRKFSEVKKGYTPIKRDDLIVAKITPCYENGKMAIADEIEGDIAFGSTEFHTFRSSDKRMIIFLYNYLMEDQIVNLGVSNMKGSSGHRRVPSDFFKNLTIPNPSSSQLEKFCIFVEKINTIKTKYNAAKKIVKNLKLSVLNESFNSSL